MSGTLGFPDVVHRCTLGHFWSPKSCIEHDCSDFSGDRVWIGVAGYIRTILDDEVTEKYVFAFADNDSPMRPYRRDDIAEGIAVIFGSHNKGGYPREPNRRTGGDRLFFCGKLVHQSVLIDIEPCCKLPCHPFQVSRIKHSIFHPSVCNLARIERHGPLYVMSWKDLCASGIDVIVDCDFGGVSKWLQHGSSAIQKLYSLRLYLSLIISHLPPLCHVASNGFRHSPQISRPSYRKLE